MKQRILKSFKIALAVLITIGLANLLGLKYAATAGIITILSIQNTKKETLKSAGNRALALISALFISFVCFQLGGYSILSFAIYLFLYCILCFSLKWGEAIAMNSVLITHFLLEGNMSVSLLLNEILLFCIGISMGILINLHLHKKEDQFLKLSDEVDKQLKEILFRMSNWILEVNKSKYDTACFAPLDQAILKATKQARENYNNTIFQKDVSELNYIIMREQQSKIIKRMYESIKRMESVPVQAEAIATFLHQISLKYHRENTVEELLSNLYKLMEQMKKEQLPLSREEFEARAILYYVLLNCEEFLMLKKEYIA